MLDINQVASESHLIAVEKGWWDDPENKGVPKVSARPIGQQFANFHSEISEAWEEFRNGHAMNEVYFKDGKPEGVPIELADLLIRVLDTCKAYHIDIEAALLVKAKYNMTRSYRHGGKLA